MHGEAPSSHVDFQQISKHVVADNPIWRQTSVRNARARQERRVNKSQTLQEHKRVNESTRIRGQTTARVSTSLDCN